jgi:hypothetical protein
MSCPANTTDNVLRRLVRWWRDWNGRHRTMVALDCYGPAEEARIAGDLGVSATEFRALAAKWPGSSDLLSKRMQQINLDATGIARVEPDVIRDLQRVCSFCASRGKCRHDLADDSGSAAWRDYCPNVPTFDALVTARASRSKTR